MRQKWIIFEMVGASFNAGKGTIIKFKSNREKEK